MKPKSPQRHARFLALAMMLAGTTAAPGQTRWPVISKVRIVFSMVSHHQTISERIVFYNTYGDPKGNANYAVPHLVYEPVVTLYNPYEDALTVSHCRVRISDPPVGFIFKKNDSPLRGEFGSGQYHGLGRFQLGNEKNSLAQKFFTLFLRELDSSGVPGDPIVLQPGESRDFSAWAENNWTWNLETSGGYSGRSFYDWDVGNNLTNRDLRTGNNRGVETVSKGLIPTWDYRAGFQTDSLSYGTQGRPAATLYDFEASRNRITAYVVTKLMDTVTVQAKAMRMAPWTPSSIPDFQVAMLRGQTDSVEADTVRSYPMSISNIIQDEESPVVTKTYQVGAILQKAADPTHGGKTPFAMLSMVAKPEALLANNFYQTPAVPSADLYDIQFDELDGYPSLGFPAVPGEEPALKVLSTVRSGDTMTVDFTGDPGIDAWRVMGTADLAAGFTEDLTALSQIVPGPLGSGAHQMIIDVTGKGATYFVRIESAED